MKNVVNDIPKKIIVQYRGTKNNANLMPSYIMKE